MAKSEKEVEIQFLRTHEIFPYLDKGMLIGDLVLYSWKEVGQSEESSHPMVTWIKTLS